MTPHADDVNRALCDLPHLARTPENTLHVVEILARADSNTLETEVEQLCAPPVEGKPMIAEVIKAIAEVAVMLSGAGDPPMTAPADR